MFKRLTHARFARAGIATAVIAAAVIVAVSAGALSSGSKSQAANPMSMTVSNPASAPVGGSFAADVLGANPGVATWGGYNVEVGYNPSIITVVTTVDGGANAPAGTSCTTGGGNWGNPQNSPTVQYACAFQTSTAGGTLGTTNFTCVAPGTSSILLIDPITDPIAGSSFFDGAGVNIGTDLINSSVTCVLPITKTVSAGPYIASVPAQSVTYTVHVGNPTAVSISGLVVGDSMPAGLTATAISSPTDPGALCSLSPLGCIGTAQPDPIGLDVVITADIGLSAAGTTQTNCAQLDPPSGPVACVPITVAPASLSIVKAATLSTYSAGNAISWTITVTNTGASTAAAVSVTDTPTDGLVGMAPLSFGPADLAGGASVTYTVSGNVTDPAPTDQTCNNSATATATNTASASTSASAPCKPPFPEVAMVKLPNLKGYFDYTTTGGDPLAVTSRTTPLVNLWLCKGSGCDTANGQGGIDINEFVIPATLTGADPDGVGAFEFQLKYDNHIFDINITPTNWLWPTGRIQGDVGIGGCAATIITENDIRFGCVSKDDPGIPGIGQGQTSPGNAATIKVTPKADLVNRITPGNDNGAIRTLLDEGCELADIWGHPLSAADGSGTGSGYDALGREIPLAGILPGGQVADCRDITITIRILEGDMNLDCGVTVADDQIEASHYGATFGNLLYQPWYDLEPWLKDGDVDIKDLQKVFGRNGSTCAAPVPAQPALPEPVDP